MSNTHPVDPLMKEHQLILAVLEAMERKAAKADEGDTFDPDFWLSAADFIRSYADCWHHGKEEDLLFPALVACGIPAHGGPIGVMMDEHVQGREHCREIAEGARENDPLKTHQHALAFVALLRSHIAKEDNVLYEMARMRLPAEGLNSLLEAFNEFESTAGGDELPQRYRRIAEKLCTPLGVDLEVERGGPGDSRIQCG